MLPHWIEHNEEHMASFERWMVKSRELGWEETASRNQALAAALKVLER